ncbi:MAG: hypothetical protein M0T74_08485 [Desulfitobacterium hafniense]|nr:hypothetical protein [Desulfitobacterium hafniense]
MQTGEEKLWYQRFHEDISKWHMQSMEQAPYVIAHEYCRLHNMIGNGEIYGAFFLVKDIYEVIIKYYVLCATAIAANCSCEESAKALCNPKISLSMGDWVNTLPAENMKFFNKRSLWGRLIGKLRTFYNTNNIVRWRNDNIGHGALGFAEEEDFISELQHKMLKLRDLLIIVSEFYDKTTYYLESNKLIGFNKSIESTQSLFIEYDGRMIPLAPFMVTDTGSIWFYDSMDRDGLLKIINYITGKRRPSNEKYFSNLRRKYFSLLGITETEKIGNALYKKEVDTALDAYYSETDYQKPVYMLNWLRSSMDSVDRGVFLMCADRGTGKSAFSYALDGLGDSTLSINSTVIRSYYCNRTSVRTFQDFTTSVSRLFFTSKDGSADFRSQFENALPSISFKDEDRQNSMAKLLETCQNLQRIEMGKDRLLLIIDGIDELEVTSIPVIDFIPAPSNLPEGVYILLTCRSDSLISPVLLNFIQSFGFTRQINFQRTCENRDLLIKTIQKLYSNNGKTVSIEDAEKIVEPLDNRFTGIRILKTLIGINRELEFLKPKQTGIIKCYFQEIEKCYGQKYFRQLINYIIVLALSEHPLTMTEIISLSSGEEICLQDIAFLYDLKPVSTAYHNIFGGLLLWKSNDELTEFVETEYKDEIIELMENWHRIILYKKEFSTKELLEYSYLFSHFYNLWKRYARGKIKLELRSMENINNFGVMLGQVNKKYYLVDRCRLIYDSVVACAEQKIKEMERITENRNFYMAVMVNWIHSLVDCHDYDGVQKIETRIKLLYEEMSYEEKDSENIQGLMFKYYGDIFIFHSEQRHIKESRECYENVLKLKKAGEKYGEFKKITLNYAMFLKEVEPDECITLCKKMEQDEQTYSKREKAMLKYCIGVSYDSLMTREQSTKYADIMLASLDEGFHLISDALLCPQNLEVNRTQAILLEAKSKCYRKWYQDYDKAIKAIQGTLNTYSFHINMENFIDIADVIRALSEVGFNYILRNQEGDRKIALTYLKQAVDILDAAKVQVLPLLSGKIYYDYGQLLKILFGETDEIIRALSMARDLFRQCGPEYKGYVEEISEELKRIIS